MKSATTQDVIVCHNLITNHEVNEYSSSYMTWLPFEILHICK